jgi:hypothetical protein
MSDYQRRRTALTPYGANDPAFDDAMKIYQAEQASKTHQADQAALKEYRDAQLELAKAQRKQAEENAAFSRRHAEAKFAEQQAMNAEHKLTMGVNRQSAEALTAERIDKAERMKKAQAASILSTAMKQLTLPGQNIDTVTADMPDAMEHLRKRFPNLATMKPEELQRHIDFLDEVAADTMDYTGAGKQARATALAVKRAELEADAAKERERMRAEAALKKQALRITPLDHVTIRKALIDATGKPPHTDTINAVADLVKNQGVSLQEALKRVRVPLKGRDETIMAPAREAFRNASAEGDEIALAAAREGVAKALQQTDTPEDTVWDSESGTLVPRSALTPSVDPDAEIKAAAAQAAEATMVRRGALTPSTEPDIKAIRTAQAATANALDRRDAAAAEAAKQSDKNQNGIADADEVAMAWAKENAQTNPIKSKAIMERLKAKYPGIYGVQTGGK